MEQIQEMNTIIHDWMGNKRMKGAFGHWWIGAQKPEDLKYHHSWDWIMPVWCKIMQLGKNEFGVFWEQEITEGNIIISNNKVGIGELKLIKIIKSDKVVEVGIIHPVCYDLIIWQQSKHSI